MIFLELWNLCKKASRQPCLSNSRYDEINILILLVDSHTPVYFCWGLTAYAGFIPACQLTLSLLFFVSCCFNNFYHKIESVIAIVINFIHCLLRYKQVPVILLHIAYYTTHSQCFGTVFILLDHQAG